MSWSQWEIGVKSWFKGEQIQGSSQDGRVGRLWAHLLPKAHQLFTGQLLINKKTERLAKRSSTTKVSRRNHNEIGRRVEMCIVKTHSPGWATHKQKDNYNCTSSPQSVRSLSPTWDSYTRRRAPRMFGFEAQQGLHPGEPEGCGKQTPPLQGAHKISHTLGARAEALIWKEPG